MMDDWFADDAMTPRNAFRAAILQLVLDAIADGELADAEIAADVNCSVALVERWRGQATGLQ